MGWPLLIGAGLSALALPSLANDTLDMIEEFGWADPRGRRESRAKMRDYGVLQEVLGESDLDAETLKERMLNSRLQYLGSPSDGVRANELGNSASQAFLGNEIRLNQQDRQRLASLAAVQSKSPSMMELGAMMGLY